MPNRLAVPVSPPVPAAEPTHDSLPTRLAAAGFDARRLETLPFGPSDATAGSETELQAAVIGSAHAVDLPRTICSSNYFANVIRRAAADDTPRRAVSRLEALLENNSERVWDNSWVRFPRRLLSPYAESVFENDLRSDKADPGSASRSDAARFTPTVDGEPHVRVPISYLLKLALADALDIESGPPDAVRAPGVRLMAHFLSDNTSPETVSFHVVPLGPGAGGGLALARETAKRYLLSQLLTAYANAAFGLKASGQEATLFASPHPPVRQRRLNDAISDAFYRELFMSPCLSGWDRGEAKRDYMALCHQTLSRSQLNAVAKLREAGVITRNLVVLPNTSNISLANNGAHISLGSRLLTERLASADPRFTPADEKAVGDLVIKIFEHFLPLFVGTYSAAPYRLDFADFHPEKTLGFLPHQLESTHLRMIWRRWRGKARNRFFGASLRPIGPQAADRFIAAALGLRGDFVPDFRLIDYLVSPLSTERSPALDGVPGNERRLLRDLDDLGVFDSRMSLYLLYRLREFSTKGFSGFEGRQYSLFASFRDDMTHAVNLQLLLTALAWRYAAGGAISHAAIPDRPALESERRQIVFAAAIGIPTFFIDEDSPNLLLRRIVRSARNTRSSGRYPGRVRVYVHEYQRALLDLIERDAADLVEALGARQTMDDLRRRLEHPEASAAAQLVKGVLRQSGARSPFELAADEYNLAAERHYRGELRRRQTAEAFAFLSEDFAAFEAGQREAGPGAAEALQSILGEQSAGAYLARVRDDLLDDRLPPHEIQRLIHLALVAEYIDAREAA